MNLEDLSTETLAEEGVWCRITHPKTGEDTDIEILLIGTDSKKYREAQNKIVSKRLNNQNVKVEPETLEIQQCKLLAAATLAWKNMVIGGKEYPFNENNAFLLYKNPYYSTIKTQVDKFLGNDANFLKAVSENLQSGLTGVSAS